MKLRLLIIAAFAAFSVKAQKTVYNPLFIVGIDSVRVFVGKSLKSPKTIAVNQIKNARLNNWNDGFWQMQFDDKATLKTDTVFISGLSFVSKPEYRRVLETYSKKAVEEHKAYLTNLVKKYGQKYGNAIYSGVPTIGMTEEMFYYCRPLPDHVNTTNAGGQTSKQFVYNYGSQGTKYYYFTNGKLTAIQD